jgi:hypothetical protein
MDGTMTTHVNAIAERVIGTLRRECLDHVIVLHEQHLSSPLGDFVAHYKKERPPRTLGLQTPTSRLRPTPRAVRSRPVLHGLHHVYERRCCFRFKEVRRNQHRLSDLVLPPHNRGPVSRGKVPE